MSITVDKINEYCKLSKKLLKKYPQLSLSNFYFRIEKVPIIEWNDLIIGKINSQILISQTLGHPIRVIQRAELYFEGCTIELRSEEVFV